MNSPRLLRRLRACVLMRFISSAPRPEKIWTRWLLRGSGNAAMGDAASDIIFQLLTGGGFRSTGPLLTVRCPHRGLLGCLEHIHQSHIAQLKLFARRHTIETQ